MCRLARRLSRLAAHVCIQIVLNLGQWRQSEFCRFVTLAAVRATNRRASFMAFMAIWPELTYTMAARRLSRADVRMAAGRPASCQPPGNRAAFRSDNSAASLKWAHFKLVSNLSTFRPRRPMNSDLDAKIQIRLGLKWAVSNLFEFDAAHFKLV